MVAGVVGDDEKMEDGGLGRPDRRGLVGAVMRGYPIKFTPFSLYYITNLFYSVWRLREYTVEDAWIL
jgi:hypothetical protein